MGGAGTGRNGRVAGEHQARVPGPGGCCWSSPRGPAAHRPPSVAGGTDRWVGTAALWPFHYSWNACWRPPRRGRGGTSGAGPRRSGRQEKPFQLMETGWHSVAAVATRALHRAIGPRAEVVLPPFPSSPLNIFRVSREARLPRATRFSDASFAYSCAAWPDLPCCRLHYHST